MFFIAVGLDWLRRADGCRVITRRRFDYLVNTTRIHNDAVVAIEAPHGFRS